MFRWQGTTLLGDDGVAMDDENVVTVTTVEKRTLCQGPLTDVLYSVEVVQPGGNRLVNFSAEDQPLMLFSVVMFVLSIILCVFTAWVTVQLQKQDMLHHTVRLLLLAVVLFTACRYV